MAKTEVLPPVRVEPTFVPATTLILFGEASLRRALAQFGAHFHGERNHQGKGNVILFPSDESAKEDAPIRCRERLGGLLKFYYREVG